MNIKMRCCILHAWFVAIAALGGAVSASEWEGLAQGELLQVPDGTRVIFTLQATRSDGRSWDADSGGNRLAAFPDPTVCLGIHRTEICMPKAVYAPVLSGRTTWFANTLASSFELPRSIGWSEQFTVTILDSELPSEGWLAAARGGGREVMGRGDCDFGVPCVLTEPNSGGQIGEVIVLPRSAGTGPWKQSYLDRCVEPDSMLTNEWLNAYAVLYPNESLPPVYQLSYQQFLRLHERRAIEPLVSIVVETAVEAFPGVGDGRIQGRHVWDIGGELAEALGDPTVSSYTKEKIEGALLALNRRLLQSEIAMAAFACD